MRIIKLIALSFLITLPWQLALADATTAQALVKINICYDAADKIDPEFVKCSLKEIQKIPNPKGYKCRILSDDKRKSANGKIRIIFYTASGFMTYCTGTAGDKLMINSCASEQGKVVTPSDELIIAPP
ncbi:hypothetical protein TUM19329_30560 [Legionella antarctica]|uniref:Uncharacterized protein n=1 Tax=Legionella antarctica TaxID=2708020 RepID=A0A6F8T7N9_9GAMM|nr:hypothetical protein [Legionella antarctica]BCA96695.1 hypothetical protein TUM19329_30560 [Legionella antarctica]